jgi:hypothetical protein
MWGRAGFVGDYRNLGLHKGRKTEGAALTPKGRRASNLSPSPAD